MTQTPMGDDTGGMMLIFKEVMHKTVHSRRKSQLLDQPVPAFVEAFIAFIVAVLQDR